MEKMKWNEMKQSVHSSTIKKIYVYTLKDECHHLNRDVKTSGSFRYLAYERGTTAATNIRIKWSLKYA